MDAAEGIHRSGRPGRLAAFVDSWCRLWEPERDGRVYERLGLVPVFRLIAGLFGERLPPASSEERHEGDARPEEWLRAYVRTRYHELLNLLAVAVYAPLLVWLALHARWGQAAYCCCLMLTHKAALMLERYKRARYDDLLTACGVEARTLPFEVLWKPQDAVLPPVLRASLARRYFTPRRFETDRFYRGLGLEAFRRFVLALFRASATDVPTAVGSERFVSSRGDVVAFERQTRIAEATHLTGMVQHLPFALGMVYARDLAGGVYVAGMLAVNLACVLLQRWHRVRLWPLLERVSGRRAG